ncbi:MAG TPA: hypothetical protein VLE43_02730 [Candidatus Saccharimonadia bacterium]|nr:hypothetical protein [Candidatus Saccharimonadia bacterium]
MTEPLLKSGIRQKAAHPVPLARSQEACGQVIFQIGGLERLSAPLPPPGARTSCHICPPAQTEQGEKEDKKQETHYGN